MRAGITESQGMDIIKSIAKGEINYISINY